jgi:signal transduction histidine kinase
VAEAVQRTERLERLNQELDAFARHLAHELRTPIGQVAALAQLMLDRAGPDASTDLRRCLELQLEASMRMRDTVHDLLELARADAAPVVERIDLSSLCEKLLPALPEGQRIAPVEWRIQPDITVHGGASQVVLLMRNLMSNAIKYTRHVREPVITISCASAASVAVEDNGVGFDVAHAGRLFQPFARLHPESQFEGTGLGLSIVRRIVERHGGWIRAHGEPGRGARFEFSLVGAEGFAA